jgi:hypothetical protein
MKGAVGVWYEHHGQYWSMTRGNRRILVYYGKRKTPIIRQQLVSENDQVEWKTEGGFSMACLSQQIGVIANPFPETTGA